MRFPVAVGLLLGIAATAVAADDFNWQSTANQKLMVRAFDNMGVYCTTLGFSRPEKLPPDTLRKKLDAYMLLSSTPELTLENWDGILKDTQIVKAAKDDALLDRAGDALGAAVHDPDSYSKAEALYVTTVMGPFRTALSACERAAADEFLGKYFVSGHGSVDSWESKFKQQFAQGVAELKQYEAQLNKQPPKKKVR